VIAEPQAWVLIGLVAIFLAIGVAALSTRSLFALAIHTAVLALLCALAMAALDAPDVALIAAIVGIGLLAPLFLGAVSLTAKTAAARKLSRGAYVAAGALGLLLFWAALDLPEIGAKSLSAGAGIGPVYVNRALGESGLASAVMAVSANYRALDTLLAACALFIAALGAYAVLGFGERSALRQRDKAAEKSVEPGA
jgi:multicomponent Na+:H+ antiporter subunit B